MTSSTKPDLVEHITPLYIKAHDEWFHSRDDRDFWEIAIPLVAVATLQWARDNVSEKMVTAGERAHWAPTEPESYKRPTLRREFSAMIDALLQEIGGGK